MSGNTDVQQKKYTIGISVFIQNSFFSNGMPTTSLVIAELLMAIGHNVVLVNTQNEKTWWDDCLPLKERFVVKQMKDLEKDGKDGKGGRDGLLDLFIDIEGYTDAVARKKIANHIVVFLRKPSAVREIELSVYPIVQPKRNMNGTDMIWTWDSATPQELHLIEVMYRKPVYPLPYLWTPIGIEAHRQQMGFPEWFQIADHYKIDAETPWEGHIAESNMSVMSNCTIPIVILANALRKGVLPCKKYIIHNADHLKGNDFFNKNILDHCKVDDVEVAYAGRQRCTDWRIHKKSFVVSHERFVDIRPYLLDLAWNGIPFIHNSPSLAALGYGLERCYYQDNSIVDGTRALADLNADFKVKAGIFNPDNIVQIRKAILGKYGINEERAVKWVAGIMYVMEKPAMELVEEAVIADVIPVNFTLPEYMGKDYGKLEQLIKNGGKEEVQEGVKDGVKDGPKNEQTDTIHISTEGIGGGAATIVDKVITEKSVIVGDNIYDTPIANGVAGSKGAEGVKGVTNEVTNSKYDPKTITICFTDMWTDFNPAYNFFTLLLESSFIEQKLDGYKVVGISYEECKAREIVPNMVIFGPFGQAWRTFPTSVPKAHFTGENTAPVREEGVFLNMGFRQVLGDDRGYLRLPLWMLEIDWFGADADKIVNPKPLPLDSVVNSYTDLIPRKTKFCSFIVTNGMNPVRNNAFKWLNAYKHVDSAGRLFNNVGDALFAGLGGGGGELKKHEFLKDYKFSIAYENASSEGYTTEKILHAKAAGCIPIYWGDPMVNRDFDANGFLNAEKVNTPEDLIALVQKVENDDELYRKMMSIPALDSYRLELARRRLSRLVELMYKGIGRSELCDSLPRFLGGRTSAEAEELCKSREGGSRDSGVKKEGGEKGDDAAKQEVALPAALQPYNNMVLATTATAKFAHCVEPWLKSIAPLRDYLRELSVFVFIGHDFPGDLLATLSSSYPYVIWKNGWEKDMEVDVKTIGVDGGDAEGRLLEVFDDVADPSHYAWKLWNYKTLVHMEECKGRVVWYFDVGALFVRFPFAFLDNARNKGVCVVEDKTQINRHWCHADFCNALAVTDAEKDAHQILGGVMAFVGGHAKAMEFFDEAWSYGRRRSVIVGRKWTGVGEDGKPYGHRHDQSILSILATRRSGTGTGTGTGTRTGLGMVELGVMYNDKSVRDADMSGAALYFYRGGPIVTVSKFAPAMDAAYIINLDRREDRMTRFYENHDGWTSGVSRYSAVDGRELELTPSLTRLFQNNDFLWKKAIMGCALSHLGIWKQLADDKYCDSYLVLEDDVKFQKDWIGVWSQACHQIPADWDILYLGGILPPNKVVYDSVVEPLGTYWGRIRPNQIFGQRVPTPYFHFCNYSYVIRKSAARKILGRIMERDGYFTSADHMICNQIDMLKMYVLRPLVAGCYQDDDPKYKDSQFNNYQRVDGFDSDLWNNDERFEETAIKSCKEAGAGTMGPNWIASGLRDVVTQRAMKKVVKKTVEAVEKERLFLVVDKPDAKTSDFLEQRWLNDLLRKRGGVFSITNVSSSDPVRNDCPIFCVTRGDADVYKKVMKAYEDAGADYCAIHFSDEYCNEPIDWYSWAHCRGVVRFYHRKDIPAELSEKVFTIALGYNAHVDSVIDGPWVETPSLPFRENVWSFFGTAWKSRDQKLEPLKAVGPHMVKTFGQWMDPGQLKKDEYCAVLLNSMFVPCPRGQNMETYRIYEAIQHGAYPIIVDEDGTEDLLAMYGDKLHMLKLNSWVHAAAVMNHLSKKENKHILEQMRTKLYAEWFEYKDYMRKGVCDLLRFPEKNDATNGSKDSVHAGLFP